MVALNSFGLNIKMKALKQTWDFFWKCAHRITPNWFQTIRHEITLHIFLEIPSRIPIFIQWIKGVKQVRNYWEEFSAVMLLQCTAHVLSSMEQYLDLSPFNELTPITFLHGKWMFGQKFCLTNWRSLILYIGVNEVLFWKIKWLLDSLTFSSILKYAQEKFDFYLNSFWWCLDIFTCCGVRISLW